MSDIDIDIAINKQELIDLLWILDEIILKRDGVEYETATFGAGPLNELRAQEAVVEMQVEATVFRLTQQLEGVADLADETDDKVKKLRLPTIDRATRMILYRIPGLRNVLRMLYQIKVLTRAMGIAGRGEITAIIVAMLFIGNAMGKAEREREKMEARLAYLETLVERRIVTMEEALRGYSEDSEDYRSGVVA